MVKFNLKRLQTDFVLGVPQKPKCLTATTLGCLPLNFWAIYFDQRFLLPTSHTTTPPLPLPPPSYILLSELPDWKGVWESILSSLCSGQGQPGDQTRWLWPLSGSRKPPRVEAAQPPWAPSALVDLPPTMGKGPSNGESASTRLLVTKSTHPCPPLAEQVPFPQPLLTGLQPQTKLLALHWNPL